jgi:hypothetical protein
MRRYVYCAVNRVLVVAYRRVGRRYPGLTAVPTPVARNTVLLAVIWAMAGFHGAWWTARTRC